MAFDGHPLRKDFPLTGFVEVRYDDQERGWSTNPSPQSGIPQIRFPLAVEGADYPVLPGDEKAGVKP